jgi:hypothetical protein
VRVERSRGCVHRDADSGSSTERLSPKAHVAVPILGEVKTCIQVRRVSGKGWHEQLGENTSFGMAEDASSGSLPFGPLRQAQGPSESVEMTDISRSGEPSILMPRLFGFIAVAYAGQKGELPCKK